jgi:hypothetical protein
MFTFGSVGRDLAPTVEAIVDMLDSDRKCT